MNIEKIEKILAENNQPKFRLDQIKKAIYQDGISSFLEISNLPKELREILDKERGVLSFDAEKVLVSKNKDSIKAMLKLKDSKKIETVLMSAREGNWSVCISCQVGCQMNCAFCATGKGGFKRNLTAEEIVDQVLFWKQYLKKEKDENGISNIVYMGMGEPFLNWEEILASLKVLTDPKLMNFGSRSISISSVGILGSLEKLTRDFPQVNLAISLHFSSDQKREKFMPANKGLNLKKLKNELEKYFEKSNRKVFLEYILFDGINDTDDDMQKLLQYIKSFKKQHLLHVNLIRYNSINDSKDKFEPSSMKRTIQIRDYFLKNRINCTIRKSLGEDISGACGQLAGE